MTSVDELHESWAAEPPAVGRARAAVAAFAREAGASPELLDDVRLAVSEAATNVVLHAYVGTTPGPLHVRARVRDRRLEVEVCDEGGGVRARTDSPGLGIGLSLISTVTDSVEITSPTAQENRVRMLFDLDPSRAPLA
jgi:anti-sigma regulatory factor (Ser/Thr protein kinase)